MTTTQSPPPPLAGLRRPRIRGGACEAPDAALLDLFFPERLPGQDNHGAAAKLICASCPLREACLAGALAENEEHGIWGGAGEQRRRTLRRAQANDRRAGLEPGDPASELAAVWAAHWRQLDECPEPGDSDLLAGFGPNATHGNAATYAKGCRCDPCSLAVAKRTATTKLRRKRRPPGGFTITTKEQP